jgi:hypothetical protein
MLKKFWLGQTPMWFNYWILGIILLRAVYYVTFFIMEVLGFVEPGDIFNMVYIITPLYIFWGIGTWRSAQIYKGRKLWSSLTELSVILNFGLLLPFFL